VKPSFIGSTVAIVIGVISIGTQLSHISTWVHMDNIVGGITAIFGAVAYRLAKERRLGFKPDSVVLRNVEAVLLAVVVGTPVIQTVMGVDFVTHPWSNLLIPVWTVIAYLYVRLKKAATTRLA
jgi:intracellular septation protein A